jgi:DNA-binding MarR family transcriptional regulator
VPREPLLKLEDFLPYLVNRVGTAMVARFSRGALAAHHLTIDMWRALAALSNNGGQRQIDLAGLTSIEPSTTSRVVTRLVRNGLVIRSRSKISNREVLVQLTAKGRALVRKLIPVAIALERSAAAGLPANELALVKQALRKVYGNLSRP